MVNKIKSSEPSSAKPQPRVYTLDEAAVILRICRGSAYRAAENGDIPTVRIGRRLLVPAAALDKLLASVG